jgi:hypothetical protein
VTPHFLAWQERMRGREDERSIKKNMQESRKQISTVLAKKLGG